MKTSSKITLASAIAGVSFMLAFVSPLTLHSHLEPAVLGLLVLLALALSGPLIAAVINRSFDPLESIHLWIPVYSYTYLIKPLARLAQGESFLFGESNLQLAITISIIGLLSFYCGYYSEFGAGIASHVPAMNIEVSRRRLRRCAWIFILIGAAGLWTYMEISGGWRQFWSLPHGYGGRADLTTAYIYQLPELMIVGFFLIVHDAMADRRINPLAIGRIIVASIGGVMIYTILWSRRTFVMWILLTLFTMIFLRRGKRPTLAAIVFFWLVALAAVSLTLAYRPYLHLGASVEDFSKADPVKMATSGALSQLGDEYDTFLAVVSLYPDTIEYDYFLIYARIFIHPIPRLIWPDKPPLFVSSWDAFLLQSGIGWGASESLLGDLYIQMGGGGVIIGMFVSGALWKLLYAYLRRTPSCRFTQLFYAVAIGNVPSFIVQSAISGFWKWLPIMIPSIIFAYWVSKRSPRKTRMMGFTVSRLRDQWLAPAQPPLTKQ